MRTPTKVRIGTPYFPSLSEAYSYYRAQYVYPREVDLKVRNQEIFIGPPPLKDGDELFLAKECPGSRFYIEYSLPDLY